MKIIHIPLQTELPCYQLYQAIRYYANDSFLLESGAGSNQKAELSIIGFEPEKVISLDHRQQKEDFFSVLKAELRNHKISDPSRYVGGLVGTFSYDAFRAIEPLPDQGPQDKKFPDALFGLFLDGIIYNHIKGDVQYFYYSRNKNRYAFVKNLVDSINSGFFLQQN
ncbi:MAG: hypothetical protein ACFFBD_24005, partial [Candidatus Hodarchaeota archaeon]